MTSLKRTFVLLCAVAALTSVGTPLKAACRPNSPLDINQILDPSRTSVTRSGLSSYTVILGVRNDANVSFLCNRMVPNCTTDGITHKPALSTDVPSVIQGTGSACNQFTVNVSGINGANPNAVVGFRIRFETGVQPFRETFQLIFNKNFPIFRELVSVNNVTDTDDF